MAPLGGMAVTLMGACRNRREFVSLLTFDCLAMRSAIPHQATISRIPDRVTQDQ